MVFLFCCPKNKRIASKILEQTTCAQTSYLKNKNKFCKCGSFAPGLPNLLASKEASLTAQMQLK